MLDKGGFQKAGFNDRLGTGIIQSSQFFKPASMFEFQTLFY